MKRQFFLALLMGAAGLFAACQLDEKQEANVDPEVGGETYSINVNPVTYYGYAENAPIAEGGEGKASAIPVRAAAKTPVTLKVDLPTAPASDNPDDPVYWFVKSVSGNYSKKGIPTEFKGFEYVEKTDAWTFPMTEGDLKINVAFTTQAPDPNNADLAWLGSSVGDLVQSSSNTSDYKLLVPYDTTDLYIYAQAENPYLRPVLTKDGVENEKNLLNQAITLGGGGGLG